MFSWHTLVYKYQSIIIPHNIWVFLLSMCIPSWPQLCHNHNHDNEFSYLQCFTGYESWEHLWDAVELEIHGINVQLKNVQKLCADVISTWSRLSKKCFQHSVESMPQRILAGLRANESLEIQWLCMIIKEKKHNKSLIWNLWRLS